MKQETIESATSYAVGTAGITVGTLMEISNSAQAIAIILGCIVVLVRLIHDSLKLYRYWKGGR